jgi:putative phosphoesterase
VRIALISDLHGNQIALDAVLAEVQRQGCDQLICLGDVATLGPCPRQVIATLQRLGCPCILGNHDAFLLDRQLIHTYTEAPEVVEAVTWCQDQVTAEDLAFLGAFLPRLRVALPGDRELLVFHGSPRSHMEDLLEDISDGALDDALDGHRADVLAGGHTHLQLIRPHGDMLLVNPGSLGLPFAEYPSGAPPKILPRADFGIVVATEDGVSFETHQLPLDPEALIVQLGQEYPLRHFLTANYRA